MENVPIKTRVSAQVTATGQRPRDSHSADLSGLPGHTRPQGGVETEQSLKRQP